mgnify:CR=1 FL=1
MDRPSAKLPERPARIHRLMLLIVPIAVHERGAEKERLLVIHDDQLRVQEPRKRAHAANFNRARKWRESAEAVREIILRLGAKQKKE